MWTPLALVFLASAQPRQDVADPYAELAQTERQTPVTRVVQAVTPSVVTIETETASQSRSWPFSRRQVGRGGGTGVVVHEDGYVVTNYHVVHEAQRIQVSFADDPVPYPAEVRSYKRDADLALLIILQDGRESRQAGRPSPRGNQGLAPRQRDSRGKRRFQAVRMGTSVDLMAGETVIAIGNPHGQTHTVSTGIVSGLHRDVIVPPPHDLRFEGLIQTDASINLGNSGGPLLNVRGELIGINTVMNTAAENIGFAIPVDKVLEVLEEELFPNAGSSWLGLELREDDPLRVARVWADGPAAAAGICGGDRLISVGSTPLTDHESWVLAELQVVPGSRVEIGLERGGQRSLVEVQAWDKQNGVLFDRVGATFGSYDSGGQRFAMVTHVASEGPAADLGLEKGDLIPALRPKLRRFRGALFMRDSQDLVRVVSELQPGTVLKLNVFRDLNRDRVYARDEGLEGDLKIR